MKKEIKEAMANSIQVYLKTGC